VKPKDKMVNQQNVVQVNTKRINRDVEVTQNQNTTAYFPGAGNGGVSRQLNLN
jgi:hypothetical protein